jgi:hypothetical protein
MMLAGLTACGVETATTAATSAEMKRREMEQAKKTLEQTQQKIEQNTQQLMQKAAEPEKSAGQ